MRAGKRSCTPRSYAHVTMALPQNFLPLSVRMTCGSPLLGSSRLSTASLRSRKRALCSTATASCVASSTIDRQPLLALAPVHPPEASPLGKDCRSACSSRATRPCAASGGSSRRRSNDGAGAGADQCCRSGRGAKPECAGAHPHDRRCPVLAQPLVDHIARLFPPCLCTLHFSAGRP